MLQVEPEKAFFSMRRSTGGRDKKKLNLKRNRQRREKRQNVKRAVF
jgi:hypothetical protein